MYATVPKPAFDQHALAHLVAAHGDAFAQLGEEKVLCVLAGAANTL